MAKIKWHKTVDISAPIEDVFHLFNVENFSQIKPEFKNVQVVRETNEKIGSKYKVTHEEQGKTIEYIVHLDDFKNSETSKMMRFSYTISRFFEKDIQYNLMKKSQDETTLIYSGEMRGKYVIGNMILKLLSKSHHDKSIEALLTRIQNIYKK
ncbi:hypothetical protein [Nosocomiicoccus ampullae]|uniref:hypothetical protein n=1 Tax=Nosocomiicoccus ampullae TaxID=489910 RepID=UPI001C5EB025|nr:hypothetical protein [Nosocomiicoccus ampullae]QYA48448.1 hypothetical protein KPF52_08685 [Nosocomiicoccus ampullae]